MPTLGLYEKLPYEYARLRGRNRVCTGLVSGLVAHARVLRLVWLQVHLLDDGKAELVVARLSRSLRKELHARH